MPEQSLDTVALQACLDRWRAGDREAANDLMKMALDRLEKLARRMTRAFPNVRGVADTDDVLHNSLLRLLRTLQRLRPARTRDFFNLAAVHIRRELLDLARRSKNRRTVSLDNADSTALPNPEPIAPDDSGPEADRWVRFHEAVDRLPPEEREIVGLVFYHEWSQEQIAELLGVNVRTVRRKWKKACERFRAMAAEIPEE
jgi:RNA polymerase sigma factor (sigma-70 family)